VADIAKLENESINAIVLHALKAYVAKTVGKTSDAAGCD
jgi:hypothetical protein